MSNEVAFANIYLVSDKWEGGMFVFAATSEEELRDYINERPIVRWAGPQEPVIHYTNALTGETVIGDKISTGEIVEIGRATTKVYAPGLYHKED